MMSLAHLAIVYTCRFSNVQIHEMFDFYCSIMSTLRVEVSLLHGFEQLQSRSRGRKQSNYAQTLSHANDLQ